MLLKWPHGNRFQAPLFIYHDYLIPYAMHPAREKKLSPTNCMSFSVVIVIYIVIPICFKVLLYLYRQTWQVVCIQGDWNTTHKEGSPKIAAHTKKGKYNNFPRYSKYSCFTQNIIINTGYIFIQALRKRWLHSVGVYQAYHGYKLLDFCIEKLHCRT